MSNNTKIEDIKTGDTVASHPSPSAPVVAEQDFAKGFAAGFKQGQRSMLPTDEEVGNWFTENIDMGCSASSGIYKFRLWLKERLHSPAERIEESDWKDLNDQIVDILFDANGTGSGTSDIIELLKSKYQIFKQQNTTP